MARMSITGRIVSPNDAMSPLTGMRAALFRIGAGLRRTEQRLVHDGNGARREEVEIFDELDHLLLGAGDALIVETEKGAIEVPLEALQVVFPTAPLAAVTLDRPLPEPLQRVIDESRARDGIAAYREQSLSSGDRVRLDAWIEPSSGLGAAWRVLPERGPAVLHDRSLDEDELEAIRGDRWRWVWFAGAIALAAMFVLFVKYRERAPTKGTPAAQLELTDTEGRVFRPGKSANGQGEIVRISGPDIASVRPGNWYHIYWRLSRTLGVCDVDWRKVDDVTWVGMPEHELCRAFVCKQDAHCPPIAGVRCANGFCVQPNNPIDAVDYEMLCRAGTGVGVTKPLATHRDFSASCPLPGAECRLPEACPQL